MIKTVTSSFSSFAGYLVVLYLDEFNQRGDEIDDYCSNPANLHGRVAFRKDGSSYRDVVITKFEMAADANRYRYHFNGPSRKH